MFVKGKMGTATDNDKYASLRSETLLGRCPLFPKGVSRLRVQPLFPCSCFFPPVPQTNAQCASLSSWVAHHDREASLLAFVVCATVASKNVHRRHLLAHRRVLPPPMGQSKPLAVFFMQNVLIYRAPHTPRPIFLTPCLPTTSSSNYTSADWLRFVISHLPGGSISAVNRGSLLHKSCATGSRLKSLCNSDVAFTIGLSLVNILDLDILPFVQVKHAC